MELDPVLSQFLWALAGWDPRLREQLPPLLPSERLEIPPNQTSQEDLLRINLGGTEFVLYFRTLTKYSSDELPAGFHHDMALYRYSLYWRGSEDPEIERTRSRNAWRLSLFLSNLTKTSPKCFYSTDKYSNAWLPLPFPFNESFKPAIRSPAISHTLEDGTKWLQEDVRFEVHGLGPEFNRAVLVSTDKARMLHDFFQQEMVQEAKGARPNLADLLLLRRHQSSTQGASAQSAPRSRSFPDFNSIRTFTDFVDWRKTSSRQVTPEISIAGRTLVRALDQGVLQVEHYLREILRYGIEFTAVVLSFGPIVENLTILAVNLARTWRAPNFIQKCPWILDPDNLHPTAQILVFGYIILFGAIFACHLALDKLGRDRPDVGVALNLLRVARQLDTEGQLPESYRGWLGKAK